MRTPGNTSTFLAAITMSIKDRPDRREIQDAISPYIPRLYLAEQKGEKGEIVAILQEMRATLDVALKRSSINITPPDAAINPFTPRELLFQNPREWISRQYTERLGTSIYFGFNNLVSINGAQYPMPSIGSIEAAMIPGKMTLINTYIKEPILIITPIGASLSAIAKAFASKKGAMIRHNPLIARWNSESRESGDLSHDMDDRIIYNPLRFTTENNQGETKAELLKSRKNIYTGWQVLVVDGSDDMELARDTADARLLRYEAAGLVGLAPEDEIMLQAEGLRRGQMFKTSKLVGSYLVDTERVPSSHWNIGGDYRITLGSVESYTNDPDLLTRPAVRLL